MKIVPDTNVLVSGLLSPFGAPAQIDRMIASGALQVCFDARLISEYEQVLKRPKFSFDPHNVDAFLDQIVAFGILVSAKPLSENLTDRDDEPFLEVAIAGQADFLVTGNTKHFPPKRRYGISVVTPNDFITEYRNRFKSLAST